jgi:hypothetical protein
LVIEDGQSERRAPTRDFAADLAHAERAEHRAVHREEAGDPAVVGISRIALIERPGVVAGVTQPLAVDQPVELVEPA